MDEATYTFNAHRFYADGERYSTGSGLSVSGLTLERATEHFNGYTPSPAETYAIEVIDCSGVQVMHKGASIKDANASMHRAYRRRQAERDAAAA